MPKNIIFCADGTWNGPGAESDELGGNTTNVFKLFVNLDGRDTADTALLANEQERVLTAEDGTVLQHSKYLHGVGDSKNFMLRVLGGTMGAGLIARIVRGYTFISRNFEPGDRIYVAGFSRGAYTARALAGLIVSKGLLDAKKHNLADKEDAYRLGSAVWYSYRQNAVRREAGLLDRLQRRLVDMPHFLFVPPPDSDLVPTGIEAVAVWDTVGSLGIPDFSVKEGPVDGFQFADTGLNPRVRHGLHAVAVDEQRGDFTPTLWDPDPRITQALFPGAHADVGGGYAPEAVGGGSLSDCSLMWMADELARRGVLFSASPKYRANPLPTGRAHSPWLETPWTMLPRRSRPRAFPPGLVIHRTLLDRVAGNNSYSPPNLVGYVEGGKALDGISVI